MPYRIAITGSTGLVGTAVCDYFKSRESKILRLTRPDSSTILNDECANWDAASATIEAEKLEGVDVVIHLAGASIAGQRWTPEYKRTILSSRVDSTKLLARTLCRLSRKPKVFLCASAIGFYGAHQPDEIIDERSPSGSDFLADVCRQWEGAAQEAQDVGIRVVHMRLGVVLSKNGGALAQMLPIFKLGLGGKIASGRQMMSWVALDEIPFIIDHLIARNELRGAVNVVAPNAVSNAEFTKALAAALKRPAIFSVPALGVKMLFGEMGESLLLNGANVLPKRLTDSGYNFKFKDVRAALAVAL